MRRKRVVTKTQNQKCFSNSLRKKFASKLKQLKHVAHHVVAEHFQPWANTELIRNDVIFAQPRNFRKAFFGFSKMMKQQ